MEHLGNLCPKVQFWTILDQMGRLDHFGPNVPFLQILAQTVHLKHFFVFKDKGIKLTVVRNRTPDLGRAGFLENLPDFWPGFGKSAFSR